MPVRWGVVLPLEAAKEGVHVLGHMPAYMPEAVSANPGAIDWWHPATAPEGRRGAGGWFASKVVSGERGAHRR